MPLIRVAFFCILLWMIIPNIISFRLPIAIGMCWRSVNGFGKYRLAPIDFGIGLQTAYNQYYLCNGY